MGRTALYLAVSEDLLELVPVLLKHKADRSIPDEDGLTPFQYLNNFKPAIMSDSYAQQRNETLEALRF